MSALWLRKLKMDEKEFLKETIITLRTLAALLITGIFGVSSYVVSRFTDISLTNTLIMSGAVFLFLGILLFFTIWHLAKMVNRLRSK